MNDLLPYIPVHPGTLLKEELDIRHVSQRKYAEIIEMAPSQLNEILKGKRAFSTELALSVEATLGIKAYIFLEMQTRYNIQKASEDETFRSRLVAMRQAFALL